MPVPAFRRLSFSDVTVRLLETFQENVGRVLDALVEGNPAVNSRLLEDDGDGLRQGIALTAGVANAISHGLARELRGWRLIDNTADARVWRDTSNALPGLHLILWCSANTSIRLEVF